MKTLTRSMVRHAHAIAREVGARVILLHADVVEEDCDLAAKQEQRQKYERVRYGDVRLDARDWNAKTWPDENCDRRQQ